MSNVRERFKSKEKENGSVDTAKTDTEIKKDSNDSDAVQVSYWLTRIVLLRAVSFIYGAAFFII